MREVAADPTYRYDTKEEQATGFMTQFSAAQRQAIEHKDGPMMVIAGPGSGKTTVISNRIRHLIEEHGVRPSEILVITFTRAAAAEMRQRTMRLINAAEVTFGTFHSVFYAILREFVPDQLKLIEQKEAVRLLKKAAEQVFPGRQYTSDYYDQLLAEVGRIKNGLKADGSEAEKVLPYYDREMKRLGLIDFDDMLVRCRELLADDPKALAVLRRRYRYILVDEFQDINPVQYDIIRLISAPVDNLFIVGDDDQSIYAFRGSEPAIMLGFPEAYPKCRIVKLTENYRSTGRIVRASARLIRHNRKRFRKKLKTAHEKGTKLRVTAYRDAYAEGEGVIRMIAALPKGTSVGVLYRTHRAGSIFMQMLGAMKENSASFAKELSTKTVQPMTFHASKGLEFDAVFILRAEEAVTPGRAGKEGASGREEAGGSLEEERRMFYVAMTRARRFLHISYTKFAYNKRNQRSRFVREATGFRIGVI